MVFVSFILNLYFQSNKTNMNILELPFNKLIGLEFSDEADYILRLKEKQDYTNHLGSVHAAALFALAEATSAQFLLTHFPQHQNNFIPVLRTAHIKYKKPAFGQIYSKANLMEDNFESINEKLSSSNRILLKCEIELFDKNKIKVMAADFEWFISLSSTTG